MGDPKKLRQCFSKFATGVSVISCNDRNLAACGITANSFTSVSLNPPLILWNLIKNSASLDDYLHAEYFGINILSLTQKHLSIHFANSGKGLFNGISYRETSNGVPLLEDTLASFECRTYDVQECGDHFIIIGEVIDFQFSNQEPLLFFHGEYAAIDHD